MINPNKRQVAQRVARFERVCRDAGVRLTHQRLDIFREVAQTSDHPDAEMVYKRVRERMPTVSLDTVYRTLSTLQEYGLIARVEALDDRGRFDANLEQHHHFICTECKRVHDIKWPSLDRIKPPGEAKRLGKVHRICAELRGICRSCQTKSD